MDRSYSELIKLKTFEERYQYLKLDGIVGLETFGFDRYLNQRFYQSDEWKKIRRQVIIRDNGCDLGMGDRSIENRIYVHHMNPQTPEDLIEVNLDIMLNLDNLICCSPATHRAIHYGDESLLIPSNIVERKPGDTKLW